MSLRLIIARLFLNASEIQKIEETKDETLRRIVSFEDYAFLQATRAERLAHLLTPNQLRAVEILGAPDRWQPDQPLTREEAKAWESHLRTPLLVKIDVAMVNMAQQEAQRAIHMPPADAVRVNGEAVGFRRAWAVVKSLSTQADADVSNLEITDPTASAGLAHLQP